MYLHVNDSGMELQELGKVGEQDGQSVDLCARASEYGRCTE